MKHQAVRNRDFFALTDGVRERVAKGGVDDAEEHALRQARDRLGLALVQLSQGSKTSELSKREGQHYLKPTARCSRSQRGTHGTDDGENEGRQTVETKCLWREVRE